MTNHKAIQSIFTGLRPFTVGFDDMFDHFDMLTTQLPSMTATNYPPYNIVKTGSLSYDIEVALAGYSKKDVSVNYEDNILKIESVKSKEEKEVEDNDYCYEQIKTVCEVTETINQHELCTYSYAPKTDTLPAQVTQLSSLHFKSHKERFKALTSKLCISMSVPKHR